MGAGKITTLSMILGLLLSTAGLLLWVFRVARRHRLLLNVDE
jgi:ABC-type uncharacterized transport system ATPase subunit